MFGRIGAMELVLILVIALVIFGPSKLPEVGRSLGKAISEFKNSSKEITDDIRKSIDDDEKNA